MKHFLVSFSLTLLLSNFLASPVLAATFLGPPTPGPTSTLYFFHQDHLSSNSVMTDENGNIVSTVKFQPYGEERERTGTKIGERTYTDQIKDDSTNLMYYNARYYNPRLGIFTQPDQVGGIGKYSYASGNPIRFNDPSGNMELDPGSGGGGEEQQPPGPPPPPSANFEAYGGCGPGEGISTCKWSNPLSQEETDKLFPSPSWDEELDVSTSFRTSELDLRDLFVRKYFSEYIKTGLISNDPRVKKQAYSKAVDFIKRRGVVVSDIPDPGGEISGITVTGSLVQPTGILNVLGVTLNVPGLNISLVNISNLIDDQQRLYTLYHEGIHTFYDRQGIAGTALVGGWKMMYEDILNNGLRRSELAAYSQQSVMAKEVYQITGNVYDRQILEFATDRAIMYGNEIGK